MSEYNFEQVVSCGIAPIRYHDGEFQILLGQPIESGFYGLGFLKGQVENGETDFEAAKREFAEESGNLDVEIIDDDLLFMQDTPRKRIFIWPAKVSDTENNRNKVDTYGVITEHDTENDFVQFFNINDLPVIFKNQQEIAEDLITYIKNNQEELRQN